jgi:small-conductance mechanosensitive channel
MRRLSALWLGLVLALIVAAAHPVAAQGIGPQLPAQTEDRNGPDYGLWQRTAERAERTVGTGYSSRFALERLRAELVTWRDKLQSAQSANAKRINTVQAQLAAIGEAPADGQPESELVVARRVLLTAQLSQLRAPAILAQEAYAQANGLISEIDAQLRDKDTRLLTTRGASPLDPANWSLGLNAMWSGLRDTWSETKAGYESDLRRGDLRENLPRAVVFLTIAFVLLAGGRRWSIRLQDHVSTVSRRGRGVWVFLLSLGQIGLPILGLLALTEGFKSTDILGFRGWTLAEALPLAGLFVVVGRWLSGHFFVKRGEPGDVLALDHVQRRHGRRMVTGLGWALALGTMVLTLISTGDSSAATAAVMVLPVQILTGYFLFRLGRLVVRQGAGPETPSGYRSQLLVLAGRICMVVAIVGPGLAIFGYGAAAAALLAPTVATLAVLGVVVLLQRLAFDLYSLITRAPDGSRDALTPLLIGFALLLLALPVIALIWGARMADLAEIWTRFREGFVMGETRISPTNFMAFVLIFGLGYAVTRLIQGTLRSAVLPKTRLDIGGQNAISAGIGYVGIFLSAIIAITGAGIDLSSLAIVAGALSVGIGFGLQNIVSNFVSGIILLIERPISEGDWIEVGGKMGYVRDISVRSTRIETFDRTDVIVPNADLVSGQVTNWTRGNSVGRVIVPVGVAYGTDTGRVSTILQEIAEAHPMVLMAPPPNIVFHGFGADSLNFEIRAILRDVNFALQTKSEMNHAIWQRFTAEGIEIPFAQRDIWLRNPEVLRPGSSPRRAAAKPATDKPKETP